MSRSRLRMRRAVLDPVGRAGGLDVLVHSEEELQQAIGQMIATERAGTIVLGSAMTLSETLVLPTTVPGLTIRGNFGSPVSCSAALSPVFDLQGAQQRLEGVRVIDDNTAPVLFVDFSGKYGSVERCYVEAQRLATMAGDYGQLLTNWFTRSSDSGSDEIVVSAAACVAERNLCVSGQMNVSTAAGANFAKFGFNDTNGGAIDTSAGSGSSILFGNETQGGGVTVAASDIADTTDASGAYNGV